MQGSFLMSKICKFACLEVSERAIYVVLYNPKIFSMVSNYVVNSPCRNGTVIAIVPFSVPNGDETEVFNIVHLHTPNGIEKFREDLPKEKNIIPPPPAAYVALVEEIKDSLT